MRFSVRVHDVGHVLVIERFRWNSQRCVGPEQEECAGFSAEYFIDHLKSPPIYHGFFKNNSRSRYFRGTSLIRNGNPP